MPLMPLLPLLPLLLPTPYPLSALSGFNCPLYPFLVFGGVGGGRALLLLPLSLP
jgi:hypothetical protein